MVNNEIETLGNRNYNLFEKLAQVRGVDGNPAKGGPNDVARGTEMEIEKWGVDGHSPTWYDALKLVKIMRDMSELFDKNNIASYKLQGNGNLTVLEASTLKEYDRYIYNKAWFLDPEEHWQKPVPKYRVVLWWDN